MEIVLIRVSERSDGTKWLTKTQVTEEEALCKEAMEGCPVEAIGNDGE